MLENKIASATNTGFNPFNYAHQKAQTAFNSNLHKQFTQEESLKRNEIFRSLIGLLRNERFEKDGDFIDLIYDVPKSLAYSRNFRGFDERTIWQLGVCAVPNFLLNALASEWLAKRFGDLTICGGFYKTDGCWRLDIDSKLSGKGLLLPLKSRLTGLIYALKVYRYCDDPNPFTLKLRGGLNG